MAKNSANGQAAPATGLPTQTPGAPAGGTRTTSSLDNCLKLLASVQEQIRFADTKAAFVFAINTLMFGFVVSSVGTLKKALSLSPVPAPAWVGLVALILFGICAVVAVGLLVSAVMSRFGETAPRCHIFFGHIASHYGHDFERYVADLRAMSEDDWVKEVGTQIVETSHISLTKHKTVRRAAEFTLFGLVCWVIAVFNLALLPCA